MKKRYLLAILKIQTIRVPEDNINIESYKMFIVGSTELPIDEKY